MPYVSPCVSGQGSRCAIDLCLAIEDVLRRPLGDELVRAVATMPWKAAGSTAGMILHLISGCWVPESLRQLPVRLSPLDPSVTGGNAERHVSGNPRACAAPPQAHRADRAMLCRWGVLKVVP